MGVIEKKFMSNIHDQVEQELQKAVGNIQVSDSVAEQVRQEIRKATSNIQELIESERDQARTVCSTSGAESGECAAAWDAVEELQAEASHQRSSTQSKPKNSLEKYCDENPSADECRIYEE